MSDNKHNTQVLVYCPTCKKPVSWVPESKYRPFCSDRCRLIDLGEWLAEENRIQDTGNGVDSYAG